MNKHKGNSIKNVKKKIASENKTKKSRKSEVDSPDSPSFLGLGDERTQKNDENQIKNANPNPNPNREKREKRKESNRKFLFLYKKL